MDKVHGGVGRDIFFDIFKHPLWLLSITCFWRLEITNRLLEMKFSLIFFKSNFFGKNVILLRLNEVWNFALNIVPTFWQWTIKLSSSNYPIAVDDSWWTMNFTIKMTSLPLSSIECQWNNSFTLSSKKFLMVDG